MSVGRTIEESLLKAVRSLETGVCHIYHKRFDSMSNEEMMEYIKEGTDDRLYAIAQLIRNGVDLTLIYTNTKIDLFFLEKFRHIVEFEKVVREHPLDEETLRRNQEAIKRQLAKLIDFDSDAPNAALMVNNYDWMKGIGFLDFIRDIGKLITVNYMMAKDSVKKRFNGEGDGMSFTEFTYQLVQGFDFLHLYQTMNCKVQLGGADQWGNITTGTELIRRKLGNEAEAFAITCPLITKADGTKFGKTESGNVWLDARYTSPYKFYQFWLNVSDEDAKRYIRIFTLLDRETVEALTAEHEAAPHLRVLQKRLAQEITTMIHSREEYEKAVEASAILFGGSTSEALRKIDEETLLQVFEGVPQFRIARAELGLPFVDLCAEKTQVFPSKGECRKMVQGGGVSLNKEKVADPARTVGEADLIAGKYLLVQRGKKNYYLVIAE